MGRGCCQESTISLCRKNQGTQGVDEDKTDLGFRSEAILSEKDGPYFPWSLDLDATKNSRFLLSSLSEQARESNAKGGSPAELVILNDYVFFGWRVNCETKKPLDFLLIRLFEQV